MHAGSCHEVGREILFPANPTMTGFPLVPTQLVPTSNWVSIFADLNIVMNYFTQFFTHFPLVTALLALHLWHCRCRCADVRVPAGGWVSLAFIVWVGLHLWHCTSLSAGYLHSIVRGTTGMCSMQRHWTGTTDPQTACYRS